MTDQPCSVCYAVTWLCCSIRNSEIKLWRELSEGAGGAQKPFRSIPMSSSSSIAWSLVKKISRYGRVMAFPMSNGSRARRSRWLFRQADAFFRQWLAGRL